MIRSKHHHKTPMNHTIRIRISRRRWTPEDIEAGDANDPGECWDELFETEEEADDYLWHHLASSYVDAYTRRQIHWRDITDAAVTYTDDGDTRETIMNGGTIEWTATIVGGEEPCPGTYDAPGTGGAICSRCGDHSDRDQHGLPCGRVD